jgi:FkbM family methyltransferase
MTVAPSPRLTGANRRIRLRLRLVAKWACERAPRRWLERLRAGWLDEHAPAHGRRWRRALLEVVRLRRVPEGGPFRVAGHPAARMVPADSYVTNRVYWLGLDGYEPGGPAWWASLVAAHDSALEIGANVGLYTVVGALADPSTRYRAAEPNPATCATLRRNLAINGLDRVEVVEAAVVGERTGAEVTLRFPDRDPYLASAGAFVEGAVDLDRPAARSVSVPAVTARDLVDGVDLVKLDIEGLELEVLRAVRPWIVDTTPTLVVEVLDDARDLQAFLADLIAEAGYACAVVHCRHPVGVPTRLVVAGHLQRAFRTRDVTLVRPDRLERLGCLGGLDFR